MNSLDELDLSTSLKEALSASSRQVLADHLVCNYANVSLSRVNPGRETKPGHDINLKNDHKEIFRRVFGDQSPLVAQRQFTRNILIVGANVSQQAFSFFMNGRGTIEALEKQLDLDARLLNEHFEELYGLHANTLLRTTFNVKSPEEKKVIQRNLGMEGRLAVLEKLYDPKTVRRTLNQLIYHRHFPNLGYELLAHMFKHRLIDVLVNLNFDELLDNAIQDEIGDGSLHVITPENVLERSDELFTHHRLRYPIYIKPHGTAGQFSSLAYTEAHYVEMNANMRRVLFDVFRGSTGNRDGGKELDRTGAVNIAALGYGYNDLDMRRILFDAIKDHEDGQFNLFFWSRTPVKRFNELGLAFKQHSIDLKWGGAERFQAKDEQEAEAEALAIWPQLELHGSPEKASLFSLSRVGSKVNSRVTLHPIYFKESTERSQYDVDLADVYVRADGRLQKPFNIGRPQRHELLTELVSKNLIENVQRLVASARSRAGRQDVMREFYSLRSQFHMVYDFFKHGGRVPYSVFQGERSARYYERYLAQFDGIDRYAAASMKTLARAVIADFDYQSDWCGLPLAASLGEHDRSQRARFSAASLVRLAKQLECKDLVVGAKCRTTDEWDSVASNIAKQLEGMSGHRPFEITPKLYDPKYGRFRAYDSAQVIFTNLHLTYQFYCMFKGYDTAIARAGAWDTLLFSSDTARALYNLYYYAEQGSDYLRVANDPGCRILVLADNCDVPTREGKPSSVATMFDALLTERLPVANRQLVSPRTPKEHMHHMALFMKGAEPVMGLYVFKPSTRNRINPVYFDLTTRFDTEEQRKLVENTRIGSAEEKAKATTQLAAVRESTRENLLLMRDLFKEEFVAAGGAWDASLSPPQSMSV